MASRVQRCRAAHCLHQLVDTAGRHAADPAFLNDRDERFR